jgi:hypothetical protein
MTVTGQLSVYVSKKAGIYECGITHKKSKLIYWLL